ncbi:MAG: response regulator [Desulfuromonadales bacterium]|nr:response regulator [Desulfuromonadales bacterium]
MLIKNHTIMIVDDVAKRRLHLKSMLLEREGSVLEAETAETALELLRQKPADLVITETELPTRSGLYLLQEVKQSYPETEVILTTHNASSFSLLQALRHGAFDFIVRPIDTSEILFNVIDRAFAQIDLRIQNQNLLAELEHRNQEMAQSLSMMTALSEAIETINSAIEVGDLLSQLLDAALDTLHAKRGMLALIRGSGRGHFGIKMSRGISVGFSQKYPDKLPEGLLLDIARSGSPMVVPERLPAYMLERVTAEEKPLVAKPGLLSVPLYHRDRAIGFMILFGHADGTPFTDQNLQFLVQLAHHAAIALEKAGIIHQLKRQGKNGKG